MRLLISIIMLSLLAGCSGGNKSSAKAAQRRYVLIVAGQSNAVGYAKNLVDPLFLKTYSRTKIWYEGKWHNLKPSISQSSEQLPGHHGIEPHFAQLFEKQFPNDELYIIKFGIGGTKLAVTTGRLDWSPKSHKLYDAFVHDYLGPALSSAELSGGYVPLGIWWMQGEADASSPMDKLPATVPQDQAVDAMIETSARRDANDYLGNLTDFFTALYRDAAVGGFRVFIGRIRLGGSWQFRDIIRQAQMAYCSNPANRATLIDTDYAEVMAGNLHYSAEGYRKISQVLFAAMTRNMAKQ